MDVLVLRKNICRGQVVSWASAGTSGFKELQEEGDAVCCSNLAECYSVSSRSRYATSRSHDKRPWSRKRRSITSYS
ncbi:hypothetical protein Leryth_026762 [Lithospermum erythrorhizon]|nr:hypothetical protein Leryth_026762 [Lithospermum erythrorhizon]